MTDSEKIKEILSHLKMNTAEFANSLGLKRPDTIYHVINGRNGISDKLANLIIEKYPEISNIWLKTGTGMIVGEPPVSYSASNKKIPLYDADAIGGTEFETSMHPANQQGSIDVGDMLRDSEAAMRVYGNSMIPGYPPGCIIGLKQSLESFIEPGSVYVVETKYNRYIKRLYYTKDRSGVVCHSDNHVKHTEGPRTGEYHYPEFEIPFSEIVKIFIVTGVIKRNSNGVILGR